MARTHRRGQQGNPGPLWRLKPICAAVLLSGLHGPVLALPTGGQTVAGQVTVQTPSAGQMTITQGSSQAIVNWQNFSIGSGEVVRAVQPGASSVLLNRVVGQDPSLLLGALLANGQVFLINPRGIVFGRGSQVNAGSFLASTLDIADRDFLAGNFTFTASTPSPGTLISNGTLAAPGGTVALLSPLLTVNGSIEAARVGLAAASHARVDVEGDGLVFFDVRNDGLAARLDMLGRLRADGGVADVRAAARAGFADTVLNLDGIVQARSIGQRNGRIVINGGSSGGTIIGGTLDATGAAPGSQGGQVTVLGEHITLAAGSRIDVSGAAGGGSVDVGGSVHGAGPLPSALTTDFANGAVIAANAITAGNGGHVVLWANEHTQADGSIAARGGRLGGNGGLVETSGNALDVGSTVHVDTLAAHGVTGTWLLDPSDFVIGTTGGANITGATLSSALATTNVTVQTNATGYTVTSGTSTTTNSSLSGSMVVNDTITWSNASTTLTLNAALDVTFAASANVTGSGGLVVLSGGATSFNKSSVVNVATLSVSAGSDVVFNQSAITTGTLNVTAGTLNVSATGNISQNASTINVSGAANFTTTASNATINLSGTGNNFGAAVALNTAGAAGDASFSNANAGGVNLAASTVGGNLSVTASNGNIGQSGALTVGGNASFTTSTLGKTIALNSANAVTGTLAL
ncbi:MAG: filamentous hemagglutinin N-terminal domain-containing protein, partial [Pseudomonadota bacterium]|nr:filamentous hemagglutinin N-terminal domain-containing protein [Pseudomonadota bacterium]